jgi:glycerol-3-phosphate dehydrogenase (NAD(P)+)
MKIAFIGAGSWGTALSVVANDNHHDVRLWARNPEYIKIIQETRSNPKYLKDFTLPDDILVTSDIKVCLKDVEAVVIAIASQAMRDWFEKYGQLIPENTIVIDVAKGIENKTLLTMSQVISEFRPELPYVVLSGPSHAEEVIKKLPTTLVSASKNRAVAEKIQDVFSTDYIRVYTNPDVLGVELGGALKNIIALAAGITDGMGYGDNAKAALMTRGIKEITSLGSALGAAEGTFNGLTGIGDLIVTCTSIHSRNRRCGILMGQGMSRSEAEKEVGMVVEGIYATRAAYDLSHKLNIEMPIVNELYNVLYNNTDVLEAVKNLMQRKRKHEIEDLGDFRDWK